MKKACLYLLIAILLVSVALAQPPWMRDNDKTQTIVVEEDQGINWEFVGAIIAIFALSAGLVGWFLSRKERSKTSKYLKEINRAFNEYKGNAGKCEEALYGIKEKVERDFAHGRIKESAFSILDSKLDKYLSEVRKDMLGSQFELKKSTKKELNEMLEDGIISDEEYEKFSKMKLDELSEKDKKKLKSLMKKWRTEKKKGI